MKHLPLVFALGLFLFSCETKKDEKENSSADEFDMTHSDPAAIELADSIMIAMGGKENWDKTRYISWDFFSKRNWIWDKQTGKVRLEDPEDNTIYLLNINTDEGRVQIKGKELAVPDSIKKMIKSAKAVWTNDVYWLAMPFKLKEAGVILKYMGEDTLKGNRYNVLLVNFQDAAGNATQDQYKVYVDVNEKLVRYWSYYMVAGQDQADFTYPWDNYKKYGNILLSGDRSDGDGPRNIKVDETLPDKVFTEF